MSYLSKILHGCEEASKAAVKNSEEPISFRLWLQFKLHLLICSSCRNFVKQARRIDKAFRRLFKEPAALQADERFKTSLKERLK